MKKVKKRILIIGSGDIALRAIPWLARRFRVLASARRPEVRQRLRTLGALPLSGDLDDRATLTRYAGIAHAIFYCAPPPPRGVNDKRISRLLAILSHGSSLPQRLVYIGTTGVYGNKSGQWINESTPLEPCSDRALRRANAESQLRAFGIRTKTTVTLLRVPGIYAADRLPLMRLHRGEPILNKDEDVYTNFIHADDLAHIACLTLFRGRPGRTINAVDDAPIKLGDWFDMVAATFFLPRPPRMSRDEIKTQLSASVLSFMSESRRIENQRMKNELRVKLNYPTVHDGLRAASLSSSFTTVSPFAERN